MKLFKCTSVLLLLALVLAAPGRAQQGAVAVRGTLLGADGRPMQAAHVVVQDGPVDTSIVAATDEAGRFSLRLPQSGGYGMYLMGVHHETLEIPLIVSQPESIELNARLAAVRPAHPLDSVRVTGTFAAFEEAEQPVLMQRPSGGAFVRTARATADSGGAGDSVAYQAWARVETPYGPQEHSVAGTRADRYDFNREGPFWDDKSDYAAVLDAPGRSVRLVFDPAALLPLGDGPTVESNDATVEGIAAVYLDVEERERRLGLRNRSLGTAFEEAETEEAKQVLRDSMKAFQAEVRRPVRERIETEDDPMLRQWLMLRYFDELHPPEGDSLLARRVLEEVPATSPFWSYEAWSNTGASNLMFSIARTAKARETVKAYMQRAVETHPDPDLRRHFLSRGVSMAHHAGDEATKGRYYTRLINQFPESRRAERVRKQFAPDRAIQAGQSVPSFSVKALGAPGETYSDESLAGQTYLLDFWAVWCSPCVEEIPALHEAYEKYADKGFAILSFSFDWAREDVAAYREDEWPMPWKHAYLEEGFGSDVADVFDVVSIPKPILVGPDGTILAAGKDLRDDKLLPTLARVFEGDDEEN
jgi:thiol-disulfide isomerase/thioredoxin